MHNRKNKVRKPVQPKESMFVAKLSAVNGLDARRIAEIEKMSFGDDKHPNYCPGLTIGSEEKILRYFQGLEKSELFIVYCEMEGKPSKIVGYMITNPPDKAEDSDIFGYCVSNVGVDPSYRGLGICSTLIDYFFVDIVRQEGDTPGVELSDEELSKKPKAYLHVRLANHAKSIYERCGFYVVRRYSGYYTHKKIFVFENRAMLRRYQKEVLAVLNKKALSYYLKKRSGKKESDLNNVFSLRIGKEPNSGRPTGHLIADAYRMQIEYADILKRAAKFRPDECAIPIKHIILLVLLHYLLRFLT